MSAGDDRTQLRDVLDALGMARTRDWDDVLNVLRCWRKQWSAAPATSSAPEVVAAVDSAITDLTGQSQVGAAYAKAFIKRLAENGVEVRALTEAGAPAAQPGIAMIGKRVRGLDGLGGLAFTGTALGYRGCPSVCIQRDDGTREWWPLPNTEEVADELAAEPALDCPGAGCKARSANGYTRMWCPVCEADVGAWPSTDASWPVVPAHVRALAGAAETEEPTS